MELYVPPVVNATKQQTLIHHKIFILSIWYNITYRMFLL